MKKITFRTLAPYLCCLICAFAISFVFVSSAWFRDSDEGTATITMGDPVDIELTGTGENGAILGFAQMYSSGENVLPGDKIMDEVSVTVPADISEAVLRIRYSATILSDATTVKTTELTPQEIALKSALDSSLAAQTSANVKWEQCLVGENWVYYEDIIGGVATETVIPVTDSYVFPLSIEDNNYQRIWFRIELYAQAMQARHFEHIDEWPEEVSTLSSISLWENLEAVAATDGLVLQPADSYGLKVYGKTKQGVVASSFNNVSEIVNVPITTVSETIDFGATGENLCPDLSTWTLNGGATYSNGTISFPDATSSATSPYIYVGSANFDTIKAFHLVADYYSEQAGCTMYSNVRYSEFASSTGSTGNGFARAIVQNQVTSMDYYYRNTAAMQNRTTNYLRFTIARDSTYATVPYSVSNPFLSISVAAPSSEYSEYKTLQKRSITVEDTSGNVYELCDINGVKDEISLVEGVPTLTKRIGYYAFTGNENLRSNSASNLLSVYNNDSAPYWNGAPPKFTTWGYCSHLPWITNTHYTTRTTQGISGYGDSSASYMITLPREIFADLNSFKAWLVAQAAAGTPMKIYYELRNAQQIALNPTKCPLANFATTKDLFKLYAKTDSLSVPFDYTTESYHYQSASRLQQGGLVDATGVTTDGGMLINRVRSAYYVALKAGTYSINLDAEDDVRVRMVHIYNTSKSWLSATNINAKSGEFTLSEEGCIKVAFQNFTDAVNSITISDVIAARPTITRNS